METSPIVARVRELAASRRPLLVVGPIASGKVFYVTEALRASSDPPHVVLLDRFGDPEALIAYIRSRPFGPVVLSGVDHVASGVVLDLAAFLQTTARVVVGTCEDPSHVPPALMGRMYVLRMPAAS